VSSLAGALPEFTLAAPLSQSFDGVVRIAGTRVTLDSIVGAFDRASTPEEIVRAYPTVDPAAVYGALAYVLHHRAAVDAYLAGRARELDRAREQHEEAMPPRGIRARLLARGQRGPGLMSFAFDENFDHDVVSGLVRRLPTLDTRRAADAAADIRGSDDAAILVWAAMASRLLVTHDAEAMGRIVRGWAERGEPSPGVVEVATGRPVGSTIEDLVLLAEASGEREWDGHVLHLPLR
jgi:uncharacterized protein (DUF433 family)